MPIMEADIDLAFAALKRIADSVKDIDMEQETEADARLKLIDPILKDVLGWQPAQIHCEVGEERKRLDYVLDAHTGKALVEAKRPAKLFDFESSKKGKRYYSLGGAILKSGYVREAIEQAKGYAQDHGIPLAVASNGAQWVVFLGSRTDGVPFEKGFGFVFRSLEDLLDANTFKLFYGLLAKSNVQNRLFEAEFLRLAGKLRSISELAGKRQVDFRKGADLQGKPSDIGKALDPLIRELFTNLSHEREREIVRNCFVETHESAAADERLERLIAEITEDILPIDTGSQKSELQKVVEESLEVSHARTVVIVGQMGAGKSTYLDRFFEDVLPKDLKKKVLVVRLQLDTARSDVVTFEQYLRRETIVHVRSAIFGTDSPDFKELKGAFNTLYHRMAKGEYQPLFKNDPAQFEVVFGERLNKLWSEDELHMQLLMSHCEKSMKKLLCIIYDNVDHFSDEMQTKAFQHAQWVNGRGRALTILPVRDSTYWRAARTGPFEATPHIQLYLPRPPIGKVLTSRFKFAEQQLEHLDDKDNRVSLASLKGLRVVVDKPKVLFDVLYQLFASETYPNYVLTSLSGGNIREALDIFHQSMISPHMPIDKLLAAYLTQGSYRLEKRDRADFERAVILGSWKFFKQERTKRVINLLCNPREPSTSPLLAMRILERLDSLRHTDNAQASKGFESIDGLLAYFELMGVPAPVTAHALVELVENRLLEPYDLRTLANPTDEITADQFKFLKVSTSGRLHLSWSKHSRFYGLSMIEDMLVADEACFDMLKTLITERDEMLKDKQYPKAQNLAKDLTAAAAAYLDERDRTFITIPSASEFAHQQTIIQRLFVWTRLRPPAAKSHKAQAKAD